MRVSDGLSTSKSPCQGCTKRRCGCHCGCRQYNSYLEQNKQISNRVNAIKRVDYAVTSIRFNHRNRG